MRGEDERSGSLFSYVDLEARVEKDHPLRTIRAIVNEALSALAGGFSAVLRSPLTPLMRPICRQKSVAQIANITAIILDRSKYSIMDITRALGHANGDNLQLCVAFPERSEMPCPKIFSSFRMERAKPEG
jgi:hypothetical protein